MRAWKNVADLVYMMRACARDAKPVILSPGTALVVAAQLDKADAKPTRDDIALMICKRGQRHRCEAPCYECRGKANVVVHAYGAALERR